MLDPQLLHGIYRRLWLRRFSLASKLLYRVNRLITSCDLPPTVEIRSGVRFRHWGIGVVVAENTTIGSGTIIFPKCRLITQSDTVQITIGENVQLGGSATIMASEDLHVGDGVQLAAGTVLRASVAPGKVVLGESATTLPSAFRLPAKALISAMLLYRAGRWLYLRKIRMLPGLLFRLNARVNQSFIAPDVEFGRRVRLGYGAGLLTGTIVGNDVVIGAHVSVMRNVRRGKGMAAGRVIIGNGVIIEREAILIASGLLEVGTGARVKEGAVVTKSVPAGCTVAGVPARIVSGPIERPAL